MSLLDGNPLQGLLGGTVTGINPQGQASLMQALNSPMMGLAAGLLSARAPGGNFGGGLSAGLNNMMRMQQYQTQQTLLAEKMREMKEAKQREDQQRQAFQQILGSPGTPNTAYQMSEAELFPGEQPIQGLANKGTQGTGLYAQNPEMARIMAMLGPEAGSQFVAQATLQGMRQTPRDVKTIDLGDRVGVLDHAGQIVQTYPKGATPGTDGMLGDYTKEQFARANTLRDEYVAQSKDFVSIRDAYGKIQASAQNPSPAGDLSLIFAYMKILDPTSVVREGEQASARNAAGVPDQIRNLYNRVVSGQQLNPEQRGDFVGRAGSLFSQQLESQRNLENYYGGLSTRMGIKPQDVLTDVYGNYRDFKNPGDKKSGRVQRQVEAEKRINGVPYVRINGEWFEK